MAFFFSPLPQSGDTPLLFLPGWGFDARLLHLFKLYHGKTLILPDSFVDPSCFEEELLLFLHKEKVGKMAIVGWSMGAQLGLGFAAAHPGRVAALDLVAMRGSWPRQDIEVIKEGLSRDFRGFMSEFYRKCFLGYRAAYKEFTLALQDDYLQKNDRKKLVAGLDYLRHFRLPPSLPAGIPVKIIHGRKDVVAPVSNMARLPGAACEIMPHSGHMVLLDMEIS